MKSCKKKIYKLSLKKIKINKNFKYDFIRVKRRYI